MAKEIKNIDDELFICKETIEFLKNSRAKYAEEILKGNDRIASYDKKIETAKRQRNTLQKMKQERKAMPIEHSL